MRIAWFTPFSQTSSIARCSSLVVPFLATRDEVHVWHPPATDLRSSQQRLIRLDDSRRDIAAEHYDIAVYNLGNYLPFHRRIFEISQKIPGICILHDFVMHHFFAEYYLQYLQSGDSYLDLIERYYGDRGRRRAAADLAGGSPKILETDAVMEYPLFEEAIRGAYGVVVHSDFLLEQVRRVYGGPVLRLHLPHDVAEYAGVSLQQDLALPENRLALLIVGHINPNKRIELVLKALSLSAELRDGTHLTLAGPCDTAYEQKLRRMITAFRLSSTVRLTGYLPDPVLHAHMQAAMVCINLRHPVCEGASGSAVEQLLHGKPLVVNDTGFYRELPEEVAVKLPPEAGAERLAAALLDLLRNPARCEQMGAAARRFAEARFRPREYADGIRSFIRTVRYSEPVLRLSDRIGAELAQFQVDPAMAIVDTSAKLIADLFSPATDTPAEP